MRWSELRDSAGGQEAMRFRRWLVGNSSARSRGGGVLENSGEGRPGAAPRAEQESRGGRVPLHFL